MSDAVTEIKGIGFSDARNMLEVMAAGKYCEASVMWAGGDAVHPYIRLGLYIEGVGMAHSQIGWEHAFGILECHIRALGNAKGVVAGVDEVVQAMDSEVES